MRGSSLWRSMASEGPRLRASEAGAVAGSGVSGAGALEASSVLSFSSTSSGSAGSVPIRLNSCSFEGIPKIAVLWFATELETIVVSWARSCWFSAETSRSRSSFAFFSCSSVRRFPSWKRSKTSDSARMTSRTTRITLSPVSVNRWQGREDRSTRTAINTISRMTSVRVNLFDFFSVPFSSTAGLSFQSVSHQNLTKPIA